MVSHGKSASKLETMKHIRRTHFSISLFDGFRPPQTSVTCSFFWVVRISLASNGTGRPHWVEPACSSSGDVRDVEEPAGHWLSGWRVVCLLQNTLMLQSRMLTVEVGHKCNKVAGGWSTWPGLLDQWSPDALRPLWISTSLEIHPPAGCRKYRSPQICVRGINLRSLM